MTERKCIDPFLIKNSRGRAVCPARLESTRENSCMGCPKLIYSKPVVTDSRTKVQKVVDNYHFERRFRRR